MKKIPTRWIAIRLFVMILSLAIGYIVPRINGAVMAHPTKDIAVNGGTEFFSQKDPEWRDDTLGDSKYNIGRSGCLLTCLTALIDLQRIDIGIYNPTPKTVNELFSEKNVYDDKGNLSWNRLGGVLKRHIMRKDADKNTVAEIESLLERRVYPIVKVKMPTTARNHYLLVIGSRDGEFICMDPLSKEREEVTLKKYYDLIYGIRYIDND